MNSRKTIILLFAFGGLCWVVFSSWRPQVESYSIYGEVNAIYGNVADAKIKYTQDEKETNLGRMKSLDVNADGKFAAVINILPRGSVYFWVDKEGYTPTRIVKTLGSSENNNNIGTIEISSLYDKLSYKQIQNEEFLPKLALFEDECLTLLDDEINVKNIMFFSDLKAADPCSSNGTIALLKARLNVNGKIGKDVFFELVKAENGEAFIAENNSVPAVK